MKMKSFLTTKKGKICALAAAVLVLAGAIWGGYESWLYQQPKFQDLTIELGTESVTLRDFMTEHARPRKAGFVSDPSVIDLNQVGQYSLTLRHGSQEETVTLTVQDTTAPAAQILSACTAPIDALPTAQDLVSDVQDESQVRVYFAQEPVVSPVYSDVTVTVVVEDACGNSISQECVLSYKWLREEYTLELGDTLTKEMVLLNPEQDQDCVKQEELDTINTAGIGTYTLTGTIAENSQTCTVTVQDTKGPELVLEAVQRYPGSAAELEDFIESVTDVSEVKEVRLASQFDVDTLGTYEVTVEAEDIYGNVTTGQTTLWITNDMTPPTISGSFASMTVDKHSEPDFMEGISAYDRQDGDCEVVCDTSKLDLHAAGTYYITYSASDTSGNVATIKRKVVVNHDEEDTLAMVEEIAATLSDDPEEIRDYVRRSIYYTSSWGGDDPVWHGFTTRGGNCYVHAMCLKAIFDAKGIESQLIWTTNKTHYWLIVKIGDVWRHIDATPSYWHSMYSLMDDQQRWWTLSGRNWDRDAWPACE